MMHGQKNIKSSLYISNIKNELNPPNHTPSTQGAKFSTVTNSPFAYCYKQNG